MLRKTPFIVTLTAVVWLAACATVPTSSEPVPHALQNDSEPCHIPNVAAKFPTGIRTADGGKLYCGPKITIERENISLGEAISQIISKSNLSYVSAADMSTLVQIRFLDIPQDKALDALLNASGMMHAPAAGNRLEVSSLWRETGDPENPLDYDRSIDPTHIIVIDAQEKLREVRHELREAREAQAFFHPILKLLTFNKLQADAMIPFIQGRLGKDGSVYPTGNKNAVIVNAAQSEIDRLEEELKKLDR